MISGCSSDVVVVLVEVQVLAKHAPVFFLFSQNFRAVSRALPFCLANTLLINTSCILFYLCFTRARSSHAWLSKFSLWLRPPKKKQQTTHFGFIYESKKIKLLKTCCVCSSFIHKHTHSSSGKQKLAIIRLGFAGTFFHSPFAFLFAHKHSRGTNRAIFPLECTISAHFARSLARRTLLVRGLCIHNSAPPTVMVADYLRGAWCVLCLANFVIIILHFSDQQRRRRLCCCCCWCCSRCMTQLFIGAKNTFKCRHTTSVTSAFTFTHGPREGRTL